MQPFRREDMRLNRSIERHDRESRRADLIGQRRDREIDAHAFGPLALSVHRNVLPKLIEQNRRQELRPDEAAGRRMERARAAERSLRSCGTRTSRAQSGSPSTGAG
jgi:hypothetical protein